MKPFLLLTALLTFYSSYAQQQWTILNPHDDLFSSTINAIVTDKAGNVYAAGQSGDTANQYVISMLSNGSWVNVGGVQTLKPHNVIYALAEDSTGNLYAGGMFTDASGNCYVAKWDGTQWSELGGHVNGTIFSIATDKAGNVYVGGSITDEAGRFCIMKWNGQVWAELGTGAGSLKANGYIYSVLADAAGNVYAAGEFTDAGGAYYVAKWDGASWTEPGTLNGSSYITSLTKDGVGNIYAAGDFQDAAGYRYVAEWNGGNWAELGTGGAALQANGTINSILVDDSGRVNAAGNFTDTTGFMSVSRWTGSAWVEAPNTYRVWPVNNNINSLAADNAGNLYAGGSFTDVVNADHFVAKLAGGVWSEPGLYGSKFPNPVNPPPAMAVDTAGHVLLLLNDALTGIGQGGAEYWNGHGWYFIQSLPLNKIGNQTWISISDVGADSSGNIYACGQFLDGFGIARFNDSGWTELPLPPDQQAISGIVTMATDKKGNVYILTSASAGPAWGTIYRWDGSSWSNYGSPNQQIYYFVVDTNANVYAAYYDFGWDTYNILQMTPAGEQTALTGGPGLYMTNANTWVHAMTFDAAGNLYAGGNFPDSSGNSYVGEWNGKAWTKLGTGEAGPAFGDGKIDGLAFDKYSNLYAACAPLGSEGTVLGKWDGHNWTAAISANMTIQGAGFLGKDGRGGLYFLGGGEVYYNGLTGASAPPPAACDSLAGVGMTASADTILGDTGSVTLTASVTAGRGTGTTFELAADRNFDHVLAAASADSVLTVSVNDLAIGANGFFVKMQTTNSCDSVLTAIDSLTIIRKATDTTSNEADTMKVVAGPNPFGSSFTVFGLDAAKSYMLVLMNSEGLRVYALQVTGQTTAEVEGLTLKQGVYYLEVYDQGTGKQIQKIALLKVP